MYSPRAFWWQGLAIVRRALLAAVAAAINEPLYVSQSYAALALSFLTLQIFFRPYVSNRVNWEETVFLTLLTLIAVLLVGLGDRDTLPIATQALIGLIVFIPVVYFMLSKIYDKTELVRGSLPKGEDGRRGTHDHKEIEIIGTPKEAQAIEGSPAMMAAAAPESPQKELEDVGQGEAEPEVADGVDEVPQAQDEANS